MAARVEVAAQYRVYRVARRRTGWRRMIEWRRRIRWRCMIGWAREFASGGRGRRGGEAREKL